MPRPGSGRLERARIRREQEWATAVAGAKRVLAELVTAVQQLARARGHEAIEAAADQIDACRSAAWPLSIGRRQWQEVAHATRRLVEAVRAGQIIGLQAHVDDVSRQVLELAEAIQERRTGQQGPARSTGKN